MSTPGGTDHLRREPRQERYQQTADNRARDSQREGGTNRQALFKEARRVIRMRLAVKPVDDGANHSKTGAESMTEAREELGFFPVGWPAEVTHHLGSYASRVRDVFKQISTQPPSYQETSEVIQILKRPPIYRKDSNRPLISRHREVFAISRPGFVDALNRPRTFFQRYHLRRRTQEQSRAVGIRTLPPFHVVLDTCQDVFDDVWYARNGNVPARVYQNILQYVLAACVTYISLGDDLGESLPRYCKTVPSGHSKVTTPTSGHERFLSVRSHSNELTELIQYQAVRSFERKWLENAISTGMRQIDVHATELQRLSALIMQDVTRIGIIGHQEVPNHQAALRNLLWERDRQRRDNKLRE